jgi:hypothetical protein
LLAQPAMAQLRQYAEPGELANRDLPAREVLRERMADAPWQAGRWRLQPRLALGDLVYTQNVFDESEASQQREDLRAVAMAGIDAYLPLGSNAVFATFVRPSYNWWLDNTELRRFNMSYGAAMFGLFNRLTTELSAKRNESERLINNELRVPATIRQDSLSLEGRLGVRGPWQVFAGATVSEARYPNAAALSRRAPELDLLARDEEVLAAGLAYDIPDRLNLGLGWRRVESNFVDDPLLRSNLGQGPFFSLTIPGNKIVVDADLGVRRLEFVKASTLAATDETVGTLRASFEVGARTKLTAFGARDIVYSALDAGGYFSSGRTGVAASWGDETSLVVALFAETGRDTFESAGGDDPGRVDSNESYGLGLHIPLRWGLRLDLGVSEIQIDSNIDMFDRSLTSVTSSVSLALPEFPF